MLAVVEDPELDPLAYLRFLRRRTFAKIRTAMRRRKVAIMDAAIKPPWTIFGNSLGVWLLYALCEMSGVFVGGSDSGEFLCEDGILETNLEGDEEAGI